MSEPLAWVIVWTICGVDHIQWPACATKEEAQSDLSMYGEGDRKDMRVIPLYASSYAMGVADAARVCNKWIEFFGDSPELHPLHVREKETAQDIQNAIRALTSPPSVTEEWVIQRVDDTFGRDSAFRAESAVRATLAALGIKVTK